MQELEDKLAPFQEDPGTVVNPPLGTVAFINGEPGVWDGTQYNNNISHNTWLDPQNLDLRVPRIMRTGFPPVVIINPWQRRIVCSGGVLYNVAADPWPTGSEVEITSDIAIPTDFSPLPNGLSYFQAGTSQVTGANQIATANIRVALVAGPPARIGIFVRFQGDAGGGNFVQLDGLEWWY